jgi:hypothetical protein
MGRRPICGKHEEYKDVAGALKPADLMVSLSIHEVRNAEDDPVGFVPSKLGTRSTDIKGLRLPGIYPELRRLIVGSLDICLRDNR